MSGFSALVWSHLEQSLTGGPQRRCFPTAPAVGTNRPVSFLITDHSTVSSSTSSWPEADSVVFPHVRSRSSSLQRHGGSGGDRTSFIMRCWYRFRGKLEGGECKDSRRLFAQAEMVDFLPSAPECQRNIVYVLEGVGAGNKHGIWIPGNQQTLGHPDEKWHKCCDASDEHAKWYCEKVKLRDRQELMDKMGGFCGQDYCTGHRDRCLESSKSMDYVETPDVQKSECPGACNGHCDKTYFTRQCVYMGKEPQEGYEGLARPMDPISGRDQGYRVVDVGTGSGFNGDSFYEHDEKIDF